MINKTNFMPSNTVEYPSTYYRFNNKNYSPEAWSKKMYNEGYQRAETAAGEVSWSRTVSPFQRLPKDSSYASMAIFPADSSHGSAATKGMTNPLPAKASRLNAKSFSRIPENSYHPQPLQSKKSGIHPLHSQDQGATQQQSHFTLFQGKGHLLGNAADPLLDRNTARVFENTQCPQPQQSKKSGIHTLQARDQSATHQQSNFVLFQGKCYRLGHGSNPVKDLDKARLQCWDQQQKLINQDAVVGRLPENNSLTRSLYDGGSSEVFYDCESAEASLADSHRGSEAYRMVTNRPPFYWLRNKDNLLKKITADDYPSVTLLIRRLADLAPKSALDVQKNYGRLLWLAEHKVKTAQEIAQETLCINPLRLKNFDEAKKLMVASPGNPIAVNVNHRIEWENKGEKCLAHRLPGDTRNAL